MNVTNLLENPKRPVEPGNLNTCAETKLCLFLFMPALEIVCRETKVLKQLVLTKYSEFFVKLISTNRKKRQSLITKKLIKLKKLD